MQPLGGTGAKGALARTPGPEQDGTGLDCPHFSAKQSKKAPLDKDTTHPSQQHWQHSQTLKHSKTTHKSHLKKGPSTGHPEENNHTRVEALRKKPAWFFPHTQEGQYSSSFQFPPLLLLLLRSAGQEEHRTST